MRQLLFLLITFISISVNAQNVASFFIHMPDEQIPQLEEAWRKDLIDLYQSGKEATLENLMAGRSSIKKMTADYLLLQTSERSTLEIKLLPLINDTYLACVITTVNAPVADSKVNFFSLEWKPLPETDILQPITFDWFIKEDINKNNQEFLHVLSTLDMHLFNYQLSPENQTLTVSYTTPEYLNSEEREKVKPFLKETTKVYHWKSGRFIE